MQSKNVSANLRRLRLARGMTMAAAAKAADISRMAYHNIEKGKAMPRVKNLQKLAIALNVKIFDIVRPVPELNTVRFRSRKWLTGKAKENREQIKCEIALWLRDFSDLEKMLRVGPEKKIDALVKEERDGHILAKKTAEKARNLFGLKGDEIINDICGLVESAGIRLHFIDIDLKNFSGFSVNDKELGAAIIVNNNDTISTEHKIFTIAHELGHILMHPGSFNDEPNEIEQQEKEADNFAGHFLMPEEAFDKRLEEVKGLYFIDAILHLKRVFKVSYSAVLYRIIEKQIADNGIWQIFRAKCYEKYGTDFKGHKEPFALGKFDCIEDRLSRLVRSAREKGLISNSRAAEILGVSLNEMRERISGWMAVK